MFALLTSAVALPYNEAARQAYYLTDKMAYELNLTDYQYDRVYQINFDYFRKVDCEHDAYGYLWDYRNSCLASVLYTHQYRAYNALSYFFRPLQWVRNTWCYPVHEHYGYRHDYFCRPTPPPSYRGPIYGHYHGHNGNHYGHGHNPRPGNNSYRPSNNGGHKPSAGGSGRYEGSRPSNSGTNRPSNNGSYSGSSSNRPNGNREAGPSGQGRRANINRGGR